MNDEQLWRELREVFIGVFGRDDFELTPTTTANDVSYWDSLNYVQTMLAVERHFKIRFKHAEIASFENVGDLLATIKRRLELKDSQ